MKRQILLVLPNWVGDAAMATPAIRAIRERFPDVELIGVGRFYIHGVLEGNPWLDQLIAAEKGPAGRDGWLRTALRLRRQPIDTAVLFPNSFRAALFARVAGCRRRIGFARHGRSVLLTDRLEPKRDTRGRITPSPILLDYNRLAEKAGAAVRSNQMELFTTRPDEAAAGEFWRDSGFDRRSEVVCLNPGAAFGSAKLWPTEYFAALARRFAGERNAGVLVLCGPAERALADQIARQAGHPAVHSLAGREPSLGLTKACIRRSTILISTDSGPRHFAAAFRRPVVALFGPTHMDWTLTYHSQEIRLQRQVSCGPCQLRTCPIDHRCMRELRPEVVYRAAVSLLEREAAHAA